MNALLLTTLRWVFCPSYIIDVSGQLCHVCVISLAAMKSIDLKFQCWEKLLELNRGLKSAQCFYVFSYNVSEQNVNTCSRCFFLGDKFHWYTETK